MTENTEKLAIYQAKNGAIELRQDMDTQTIWATIDEIAFLFDINKSNVSRHIKNIFSEGEIIEDATVTKYATVQKQEGKRKILRKIEHFSLDIIIAVGYRARSTKSATQFRKWATQTLKEHITNGFTINPSSLEKNHQLFLQTVESIKLLTKNSHQIETADILDLIQTFSYTWFSLDSYDKDHFPKQGTKKEVQITAEELQKDLQELKQALIHKKEATELFGQEKMAGNLAGIVGNVFQSVFGQDAYESLEEKAAHLLYFIIKNHPYFSILLNNYVRI